MSTSLMDILSCGLAAVIILMIIALTSSKLQQDDLLRATFYEIRIHYDCEIIDTLILKSDNKEEFIPLTRAGITSDSLILRRIGELPAPFDSTVDIRLYWPCPYVEIIGKDTLVHQFQEMIISAAPLSGEFQLEFRVDNNLPGLTDSTYYCEYKVVNDFNRTPKEFKSIGKGKYSGRNSFLLNYSSSPGIIPK